jgi:photosystem II stability/assembly factor-like uncharacterized protein
MKGINVYTVLSVLLLCVSVTSHGQWRSSGPYGDGGSKADGQCLLKKGTKIFAGSWSSGIFVTTDNGTTWTPVNNGFTIAPVKGLTTCGTTIFAGTYWSNAAALFRTTDDGTNWSQLDFGRGVEVYSLGSIIGRNDDTTLFCSHSFDVYRSTDHGTSWESANLYWTVNCFAAIDTCVYAGTGTGGVFCSTDNGVHWTSKGLADINAGIFSLDTMRVGEKTYLFAGTWAGIYLTTDRGTSWTQQWYTPNDIRCVKTYQNYLFVGTTRGVFSSTDYGVTQTNTNLPYTIASLAINDTCIFAGSEHSDGIWQRPLSEVTSVAKTVEQIPSIVVLEQNFPNPFNPTTSISFTLPSTSLVSLRVFDLMGREMATLVSKELSRGRHTYQWDASDLPSGPYYYRLQAGSFVQTKKLLLIR